MDNEIKVLPSYGLLDLHLGYNFDLWGTKAFAGMSCYNAFDKETPMRGEDVSTHDISSFEGYWTFGRTFNFTMKLIFNK